MSEEIHSLDANQLKELEEFAGLLFSFRQIEIIMGLPVDFLIAENHDPTSAVSKAINKGRLLREAAIRKSILVSAENGSSPAQTLAVELINKMKQGDVCK